jgi:hypothetical protein
MSWERIAENRIRQAMQEGSSTTRRTRLAVVLERARRA